MPLSVIGQGCSFGMRGGGKVDGVDARTGVDGVNVAMGVDVRLVRYWSGWRYCSGCGGCRYLSCWKYCRHCSFRPAAGPKTAPNARQKRPNPADLLFFSQNFGVQSPRNPQKTPFSAILECIFKNFRLSPTVPGWHKFYISGPPGEEGSRQGWAQ